MLCNVTLPYGASSCVIRPLLFGSPSYKTNSKERELRRVGSSTIFVGSLNYAVISQAWTKASSDSSDCDDLRG
jgi:hypothetical protein